MLGKPLTPVEAGLTQPGQAVPNKDLCSPLPLPHLSISSLTAPSTVLGHVGEALVPFLPLLPPAPSTCPFHHSGHHSHKSHGSETHTVACAIHSAARNVSLPQEGAAEPLIPARAWP